MMLGASSSQLGSQGASLGSLWFVVIPATTTGPPDADYWFWMASRSDMAGKFTFNKGFPITTSDTVNFAHITGEKTCHSVYVGGAGVVQVVFEDGLVAAYTAPAGATLFVGAKRINATSTTASLMIAQYQV